MTEREIYRNNLKDREFGKKALQNFDAEQATIADRQGASEHQNSEAKPTQPKTDSSGCFGITSLQHPLVKHLVKLRQNRDYRHECKRVLLSGRKLIKELSSSIRIRTLFLERGAIPSIAAEEIFFVTPEILKKVTGLENPEPIAAEIDMPESENLSSAHFLLVLDGISDPGNLGTLLRTAKALGWDGVFLTQGSTDPYNEKALRAAKGSTFTLPWKCGTWEELSALLQAQAMTVLAADASGTDLANCSISSPLALVLGNESHGIAPELKKIAQSIAIPMRGRMESLNVASAGAILMHELRGCNG